jgi:hypothetical protein
MKEPDPQVLTISPRPNSQTLNHAEPLRALTKEAMRIAVSAAEKHGDGSHNSGTWKIAKSDFGGKSTRAVTTDALLTPIEC